MALVNNGITLALLGRGEDAIALCNEVIRRFGDASEPELRESMDRARAAKAKMLKPPE